MNVPLVMDMLAERVAVTPDAEAVRAHDGVLTYRQLWELSDRVAWALRSRGTVPGRSVGLCAARSVGLFVAFVGLLRSGGVCVALDPRYPPERLREMAAEAECELVVGGSGALVVLGLTQFLDTIDGVVIARTDASKPIATVDPAKPPSELTGADPCYLAFTSGSTGRPKGVRYLHAGLAELVAWTVADSRVGPGSRTVALTSISFDVAYQEILSTLCGGGTLVCATDDDRLDPELLWELIERERVERIFLTFVALQALALFAEDRDLTASSLMEVIVGGERLRCGADIRAMFASLPSCDLVNQWGTVEVLIATSHRMSGDPHRWPALPPVGRPLPFVRVEVCEPRGHRALSAEVLGELVVVGAGVASGYVNRPEQTAERFVADPQGTGALAYRTGDLGRIGKDGVVECLGRVDDQIKVRGHRVEPAEVEHVLGEIPGVLEAVVWLHGSGPDALLRAVIVPGLTCPSPEEMLTAASRRLPPYMVPSHFEFRTSLPRTPSGKLNRAELAGNGTSIKEPFRVESGT